MIEVYILNAGGDCPRFEVVWHIFGKTPEGDAKNAMVIERRQFIEDAIHEKLEREKGQP